MRYKIRHDTVDLRVLKSDCRRHGKLPINDHFSDPGRAVGWVGVCVCVCVCVCGQKLLNCVTFDLHILHTDSPCHYNGRFECHGYMEEMLLKWSVRHRVRAF